MVEFTDSVLSVLPIQVKAPGGEKRMVLVLSPATSMVMTLAQVRHAAQALIFAADLAEAGVVQPLAGGVRIIKEAGEA